MWRRNSMPLVTLAPYNTKIQSDKRGVSIGLATHNGSRFIAQTLEALLAQDYGEFEIVISDNASTDRTRDICEAFASQDKRIRYYRHPENIGAVENFNHVFHLSTGYYFMWAADHDLWDQRFISECVSVLDSDPSVVLCYSQSLLIDIQGNVLRPQLQSVDTRGLGQVERFHKTLLEFTWCDAIYGVMRRESLEKTGLFSHHFGPDNILLAEISLLGATAQVQDPLFKRRIIRPPETEAQHLQRCRAEHGPEGVAKRFKYRFPYLSLLWGHLSMVFRSENGWAPKSMLAFEVMICFYERIRRYLGKRMIGQQR